MALYDYTTDMTLADIAKASDSDLNALAKDIMPNRRILVEYQDLEDYEDYGDNHGDGYGIIVIKFGDGHWMQYGVSLRLAFEEEYAKAYIESIEFDDADFTTDDAPDLDEALTKIENNF